MDSVNVYINGNTITINRGITLKELSKNYQDNFNYDIIISKVNGRYEELNYTIQGNENIEFFDLLDSEANRVYLNGLVYLLIHSYKKLYNSNLKVNHSLDKGLYITSDIKINENMLSRLADKMLELSNKDINIEKITVKRRDAIKYYDSIKDDVKKETLRYNTNTYVTLYKLEDSYEYFYSKMPISTKVLRHFKLNIIDDSSFVMTFPTIYMEESIKDYEHRYHLLELFSESRKWAKSLGLEYVCDLNRSVSNSDINNIIMIDEIEKNARLLELAKKIAINEKTKIVLIAGPSSSGKTTTTNKLKLCLRSVGKSPKMISMDDYFVEREDTPLDNEGNPDFERLEAIDLELFNDTIKSLLDGKETIIPKYNFLLGKKEFKDTMTLDKDDILLIEGIHAINPKILDEIEADKKVKIYLSALAELNIDKHIRISTTDNRLLRRIVRDNRTRGYKVEDTLKSWKKVREGEEKYIFPYQDMVDYTLNTAMIYEIGVLKSYVEPLLYSVSEDSPYYNEANRLINFLRVFLPIPADEIPKDSIIREFIGGGCFKI